MGCSNETIAQVGSAPNARPKVAAGLAEILSWIEERIGTVEQIVHESGPLRR